MFYPEAPLPPKAAIEQMVESRYGFSLVDLGISEQDLALFDEIEIAKGGDLNLFSDFEKMEGEIALFLTQIGDNDPQIAARIAQIADQVLQAFAKDSAWLWLKASSPNDAKQRLRWHFDWPYYSGDELQYRFAITLKGPTTLFYPIPVEDVALREEIWNRVDRSFAAAQCNPDQVFTPGREWGVFFINRAKGALHSEPLHAAEERLFLSLVPCSEKEMAQLKPKIEKYFLRLRKKPSAL